MSTKILALIEIDADGSICITNGPMVHATRWNSLPAPPSWATAPNRCEVTLSGDTVCTREYVRGVSHKIEHANEGDGESYRALAFVRGLRWIAGEGERP